MKNLKSLPSFLLLLFCFLLLSFNISAQNVGINTTGAAPDNSALLDLTSTDKGFLITRVDTANIVAPAFGLMTLSPIDSCLYMFSGTTWMSMGGVGSNCPCTTSNNGGTPLNCGLPFTDARDNNTYGTVQIGNQCWMSENLNYITSSGNSWILENNPINAGIYGRLYDWNTATNSTSSNTNPSGVQGVCPNGWHVPSDAEWKELEIALGMLPNVANSLGWRGTNEGDALKVASWGGNNSSGFTALPGGSKTPGGFDGGGTYGSWWSTLESGTDAYKRLLAHYRTDIFHEVDNKLFAFSVRCVKD